MNVIRHERVGPDMEAGPPGTLRQQFDETLPVSAITKHILTAVSTLRDMMRKARINDASTPCHGLDIDDSLRVATESAEASIKRKGYPIVRLRRSSWKQREIAEAGDAVACPQYELT